MTSPHQEDTEQTRPDVRAADILDPNSQIGNRLRSLYAAAQDEAIPNRFLDLLEKLDQVEMASAKSVERE